MQKYKILGTRPYTGRDGKAKTAYTRLGTAWPMQSGGFSCVFEALPIPTLSDGRVEARVLIVPDEDARPPRSNAGLDDPPF